MKEQIPKNVQNSNSEQLNERRATPDWVKAGRASLVGALLVSGVQAIDTVPKNIEYNEAAAAAVEVYKDLGADDFVKCHIIKAEAGPDIDILGISGVEKSPSISFTVNLSPGDKIQTPLFSDDGVNAGGRKLEVSWVNRPPFEVNSYSDTDNGMNRQSIYKTMYDKNTPKNEKGHPDLYDELMTPGTGSIDRTFQIPVRIGQDGEAKFVLTPAVHNVFLSGLDENQKQKLADEGYDIREMEKVASKTPCAEIVMKVENGQIVSVDMQE